MFQEIFAFLVPEDEVSFFTVSFVGEGVMYSTLDQALYLRPEAVSI